MSQGDVLAALLSGGRQGAGIQFYDVARDPFALAGASIGGAGGALYNPFASTGRNLATSVGTGLVGALLAGFGANRTDERNAELVDQAINLQEMGVTPEARELVKANPRLAGVFADMQTQQREAEQARLKAEQEMTSWQNKELFKLGLLPEKERIKGMYNPSATSVTIEGDKANPFDVLGQGAKDSLFQSQNLAERFSSLADRLEKSDVGEVQLKAGRFIGALDDNFLNQEIQDASDILKRLRTGAATNIKEDGFYSSLIQGDLTVPKDQMVDRLRNYAGLVARDADNILQNATQAAAGDFSGMRGRLQEIVSRRPATTQEQAPQRFSEGGVTYEVDPATKKIRVVR